MPSSTATVSNNEGDGKTQHISISEAKGTVEDNEAMSYAKYKEDLKKTLEFAENAQKAKGDDTSNASGNGQGTMTKKGKGKSSASTSTTPKEKQPKRGKKGKRGKKEGGGGVGRKKGSQQDCDSEDSPSNRYLSSLGVLTRKFVNLLQKAEYSTMDLNTAAEKLGVQKRRIYDITNVLEGIQLIEKKPKGNILWRGCGDLDPEAKKKMENLRAEIQRLMDQEQVLELDLHQMISVAKREMADPKHSKHAFITLNDIKSMKDFEEATVMAIKAPMGTTLEVPDPDSFDSGNGQRRYNIYLKSIYGPIDVFLVSSGADASGSGVNGRAAGGKKKKKKKKPAKNKTVATTAKKKGSKKRAEDEKSAGQVAEDDDAGPTRKKPRRMETLIKSPNGAIVARSPVLTIPSPIKLNANRTPLKLGSLSPFLPRSWAEDPMASFEKPSGGSVVATRERKGSLSETRGTFNGSGGDESIVVAPDEKLIQLMPDSEDAGYYMSIMDESEGISDLFSPKHSFEPKRTKRKSPSSSSSSSSLKKKKSKVAEK